MVYAQPSSCPGEWRTQTHLTFWHANGSPNLSQTIDLIVIKEKKTFKIVDFAFLANHRVKLKESEKKDQYFDLARELKNMKETFIPIEVGASGTVTQRLILFTNPSALAGYDTRSIFMRSSTGLNSEFPFS